MRTASYIVILIIGALFLSGFCKPKYYIIEGHVTHSNDWCSGVAPGPEYSDGQRNPPPYMGLKLYIKRGTINSTKTRIYDSIVTDSLGNFKFRAIEGNYIILVAEQLKKPIIPIDDKYARWDSVCIMKNWQNGVYNFRTNHNPTVVRNNTIQINFDLREHGSWNYPCMQYSGPLPP